MTVINEVNASASMASPSPSVTHRREAFARVVGARSATSYPALFPRYPGSGFPSQRFLALLREPLAGFRSRFSPAHNGTAIEEQSRRQARRG